jgi:hypothetical protein
MRLANRKFNLPADQHIPTRDLNAVRAVIDRRFHVRGLQRHSLETQRGFKVTTRRNEPFTVQAREG